MAEMLPLTPRQQQIYLLIGDGLSCETIAERLGTSPKTIYAHRESIKQRMGVGSARELLRMAVVENVKGGGVSTQSK